MIQLLIELDYSLKNGLLRLLTRGLFQRAEPTRVRRILVLRVGALGDGVCALPALAAIRANFPEATIHLLTRTGGDSRVSLAELVSPEAVDDVLDFEKADLRRLTGELRCQRYDLFVELAQSHARFRDQLRHLLWAKWVGFPAAFGWEITATRLFRQLQERTRNFPNERTRLLAMLARNGLQGTEREVFPLAICLADELVVESRLTRQNLGDASRNVALVLGASRPQNRWPLTSFQQTTRWLLGRGLRVLLVGGPEDAPLAAQLATHPDVHDFTGQFTPLQSAVLLKNCRLCVANDTGTMHLAYAVGTPVVALFSARDYPGLWFPPAVGNHVLRAENVPCSVCLSARCADNVCLKTIRPDRVTGLLENLLAEVAPAYSPHSETWC